jgi:hypothetical protein
LALFGTFFPTFYVYCAYCPCYDIFGDLFYSRFFGVEKGVAFLNSNLWLTMISAPALAQKLGTCFPRVYNYKQAACVVWEFIAGFCLLIIHNAQ